MDGRAPPGSAEKAGRFGNLRNEIKAGEEINGTGGGNGGWRAKRASLKAAKIAEDAADGEPGSKTASRRPSKVRLTSMIRTSSFKIGTNKASSFGETFSSFFDFDDQAIYTALSGSAAVKQFVHVDRGDVRTNLMKGDFCFHDLDLVAEGFENKAPIKMKQGYIDRVDIKVPFGRMAKEPMLLEISGLYVVFGPVEANTWTKKKKTSQGGEERSVARLS
jgi:hypothetical protein